MTKLTQADVGPTIASPPNVGFIEVFAGEVQTFIDVICDGIRVWPGGSLTITNVLCTGWCYVTTGSHGMTTFHADGCAFPGAMRIDNVDAQGNHNPGTPSPIDALITRSWIRHPQATDPAAHTEALSGFGFPTGIIVRDTTLVQDGPFNGTATGAMNLHGRNALFERCYFGYQNGVAAHYTVYLTGEGNVVRDSEIEIGLSGHVYPASDQNPPAAYINVVDAQTGMLIPQSGGEAPPPSPPPDPEPDPEPGPQPTGSPAMLVFSAPATSSPAVYPHTTAMEITEGTVALRFAANSFDTRQGLWTKDHSGYGAGGHMTVMLVGGAIEVSMQGTIDEATVTFPAALTAGAEYHLAVTFGIEIRAYLDGALIGTAPWVGGLIGNTEPILVGGNQWTSAPGEAVPVLHPFDGVVGPVEVYNVALPALGIQGIVAGVAALAPAASVNITINGDPYVVSEGSALVTPPAPVTIAVDGEAYTVTDGQVLTTAHRLIAGA